MLASDVIARVRATAGDTNVLQFSDATVLTWINDGIKECAVGNNLLQKRASSTTVIGTEAYNLPTDILRLHSVKVDGVKLPIYTLNEYEEYIGDRDPSVTINTGSPEIAYVWANKLNLVPAPDSSTKDLVIDYIYDPVQVTVVGTDLSTIIPVGYHSRIVDYCLAQVAQQDDDMGRYQLKMDEFKSGVSGLEDQPKQSEDSYPYMMVADRDMGDGTGW